MIVTSVLPVQHVPSRLCETSLTGKYSDVDGNLHMTRSIGLARSQEPLFSDDLMVNEQMQQKQQHIQKLGGPSCPSAYGKQPTH